jgi:16S rRNA (adenine1518-N6/adenine1519-N6)-dimethyltransferase
MAVAKRRFGQNFLVDPRKADGLVAALDLAPADIVIEVGPGTGMLTERILQSGARLVAVELDRDLIAPLRQRFADNPRFELVEGDMVRLSSQELTPDSFKLIGNLPYNISGAIIEWLIEYNSQVNRAVITVQKEVAARLRARPSSRDYGSLSIMAQAYFNIVRLFDIPPGCFRPQPKVDSTALLLTPNRKIDDNLDYPRFRDFLRACFAQKRKTLANSLFSAGGGIGFRFGARSEIVKIIAGLGHPRDVRAERLTLRDFQELFRISSRLR